MSQHYHRRFRLTLGDVLFMLVLIGFLLVAFCALLGCAPRGGKGNDVVKLPVITPIAENINSAKDAADKARAEAEAARQYVPQIRGALPADSPAVALLDSLDAHLGTSLGLIVRCAEILAFAQADVANYQKQLAAAEKSSAARDAAYQREIAVLKKKLEAKVKIPWWVRLVAVAVLLGGIGVGIFLIVKGAQVVGELVLFGGLAIGGGGLFAIWLLDNIWVVFTVLGLCAALALLRYHKMIRKWWNTEEPTKGLLVLDSTKKN